MSWGSSALVWRFVHQGVAQRLGGLQARLVLHSVDFAPVAAQQAAAAVGWLVTAPAGEECAP
jgi:hypothetical protein